MAMAPPQSGSLSASDADILVRMAIVGCGYWGPNLIRNFTACPTTSVAMLCDLDESRLRKCALGCPQARLTQDFDEVLASPEVDAVAIATPAVTHAPLAKLALQAGKHL